MQADESRLGIYFLDVGQGDCTFVVPPAGEGGVVLFDCRDAYVAERFVANHGIRHLRAAIASHLDMDHMRGLLPFLRTYFGDGGTLDLLVLGIDRSLRNGENKAIAALLQQAIDWERTPPCAGFSVREPVRDRTTPLHIASGSDWSIDIVLPFTGTRLAAVGLDGDAPNACSAVLSVSRSGRVVHVGGDAVLGSWERLEASSRHADVIRVPHHGGEIRENGETWNQFNDLYDHVGALGVEPAPGGPHDDLLAKIPKALCG